MLSPLGKTRQIHTDSIHTLYFSHLQDFKIFYNINIRKLITFLNENWLFKILLNTVHCVFSFRPVQSQVCDDCV